MKKLVFGIDIGERLQLEDAHRPLRARLLELRLWQPLPRCTPSAKKQQRAVGVNCVSYSSIVLASVSKCKYTKFGRENHTIFDRLLKMGDLSKSTRVKFCNLGIYT